MALEWVTLKCKGCDTEDRFLISKGADPKDEDLECFECGYHPVTLEFPEPKRTF